MNIKIDVKITKNKIDDIIRNIERVLIKHLTKATEAGLERARNYTKRRLTGEVLRVQTGRLRNSIAIDTETRGNRILGRIGTNVVYGRLWELGGTIPGYTIVPRTAKALRFVIDGKVIFAKKVQMPPRVVKARPFIKPSLKEAEKDFEEFWTQAANNSIREVMR